VSAFFGGWALAATPLTTVAFGLAWNRQGLRLTRKAKFWAWLASAVVIGALVLGEPDWRLGPIGLSRGGLAVGLSMAARAFSISVGFNVGFAALSLTEVTALCGRLGFRGFGFAVGLAQNMLATLHEMASTAFQSIVLRGGLRRPVQAIRLFLVTTVANAVRYGDNVVNAATMRAFDPEQRIAQPIPVQKSDLGLFALMLLLTVAFMAECP
jgi:energy-coupling factor transporter transmembrane protein EcfT